MKNIVKKNKAGITITSLVIYVILLFSLITLVLIITSSFNERLFKDRGMAININNVNKLQYNLFNSSKLSKKASAINNEISFSNGDVYTYDLEKKAIYKNNNIIASNISEYIATGELKSDGIKLNITLKVTKYLSELTREITVFVKE